MSEKHVRTLVRNYICNRLKGKTAAENRVFKSKVTPNQGPFPAIGVYTLSDKFKEDRAETPYNQKRNFSIEIHIEIVANDGYDDILDDICLQVEKLIDFKLGGEIDVLESCKYQDTEIIIKPDGEKTTAIAVMTWDVEYFWEETPEFDPITMDDLRWIYIKYDMADPNSEGEGPDGQIDAEDHVGDLSN